MDFSYQGYSAYMNSIYLHVYNWPNPYQYNQWYQTIPSQQHDMALHPDYYTQIYTYAMQEFTNKTNKTKVVLSRNQKRKQKKRELQEELQRETKAIGSWVRLQRKDLINDLQRIKKKEQKIQQKKEKKLGHLIEIHKEIFKHHNKKNSSQHPIKRRVNTTSSKKRISQIKKMKEAFQSDRNKIFTLGQKQHSQTSKQIQEKAVKEEDWESDNEEQKPKLEQKQKPQQQTLLSKEETTPKKQIVIQPITYTSIGKLTGKIHNNICLREWVRNCPSEQLDDLVLRLVNRLAYKQAIRKVQKQDKAKKIIVSGLKQCKRTLTTIIEKKRARLLIVALNIERNPYKGGVDDQVQSIIEIAQKQKIPIINASTRANLGRAFTGKWGPRITMVSIINYQGYQDMVEQLRKEWQVCCKKYDLL